MSIIAAVNGIIKTSRHRLCTAPMPSASALLHWGRERSESYQQEAPGTMKAMNRIAMVIAGTVLTAGLLLAANVTEVKWKTASEAFTEAKASNKKIVLDVYTDWCGWCKRMDKSTYGNADVAAYLEKNYVAAKMNPEKEGAVQYQGKNYTQAEFAQALGISGYPATAFFDESGELLTVIPGFVQPADFQKVLTYFAENIHKTTTWEEYSKKK